MTDPDYWRCQHEDRGQRCAEVGRVSSSTTGHQVNGKTKSGPWYCWQHCPGLPQFRVDPVE